MFKISFGFWVYLLTLLILLGFGLFLSYRFRHPLISYDNLTTLSPKFIATQSSPCNLHIIGGIPTSDLPDGNIQVNILCANGQSSPNYLKLSALPNRTILDAINILSAVNNFSPKIISSRSWQIYLNNSKVNNSPDKNILKVNDLLEIKYE